MGKTNSPLPIPTIEDERQTNSVASNVRSEGQRSSAMPNDHVTGLTVLSAFASLDISDQATHHRKVSQTSSHPLKSSRSAVSGINPAAVSSAASTPPQPKALGRNADGLLSPAARRIRERLSSPTSCTRLAKESDSNCANQWLTDEGEVLSVPRAADRHEVSTVPGAGESETVSQMNEAAKAKFRDQVFRDEFGLLIGEGGAGEIRLFGGGSAATKVVKSIVTTRQRPDESADEYIDRVSYLSRLMAIEYAILKELEHENIVKTFDMHVEHDGLTRHIIMERLDGDMFSLLFDRITWAPRLTDNEICRAVIQIASGLEHMHSHGYVHLDVKAANILYKKNAAVCEITGEISNIYKLADFGWTVHESRLRGFQDVVSTPGTYPPEVAAQGLTSWRVDVFALGIIVAELLGFANMAMGARDTNQTRLARLAGLADQDPRVLDCADLLALDPDRRASARVARERFELILRLPLLSSCGKFPADRPGRKFRNDRWARHVVERIDAGDGFWTGRIGYLKEAHAPLMGQMFPPGSERLQQLEGVMAEVARRAGRAEHADGMMDPHGRETS